MPAPADLLPVEPPVGVLPHYITKEPTVLYMRRKLVKVHDTDFAIRNGNGDVVLRFTEKAFSAHRKRAVTDPDGKPLIFLQTKIFALRGCVTAEDDQGRELFQTTGKWTIKPHMNVKFQNHFTGSECHFELSSELIGQGANIVLSNGTIIGQIDRQKYTKDDILQNKDSYYMWMPAGVDMAFMAAVCLSYDMIIEQRNARNRG